MKQVRNVKVVGEKQHWTFRERACAILAYLFFGLVWYLFDPKIRRSDLATFHVKQALILGIGSFILRIAASLAGVLSVFLDAASLKAIIQTVFLFYSLSGIVIAIMGHTLALPGLKSFFKYFKF